MFELVVRVESDPRKPLAGASLWVESARAATSATDGIALLRLRGHQGEAREIELRCPDGHRAPKPLRVTLQHNLQPERRPEYRVRCAPTQRTLVVAVRAENGAELPVYFLGREVARTNAQGAAHFVTHAAPEEVLEVLLDNSARPELRPRRPSARFRVTERDEIFVFTQRFEGERPPARPAPRAPTSERPIRIGPGA